MEHGHVQQIQKYYTQETVLKLEGNFWIKKKCRTYRPDDRFIDIPHKRFTNQKDNEEHITTDLWKMRIKIVYKKEPLDYSEYLLNVQKRLHQGKQPKVGILMKNQSPD